MKNIHLIIIVLLTLVVITSVLKFDKFGFAISSGKAKVEVQGELQKALIDGNHPANTSVLPSSDGAMPKQAIEINKTQGNQSPIVNNLNSTSTITYESK